ncbi:phage major capsid protein [Pseudarthrobacter sp. B907]|uniref:phage major capsid protein n=1 Tax=Pseudarthrobacter sp. B907 TaxID=3158261 RepID=UPI0032DA4262
MSYEIEAKRALFELGNKAQNVVKDSTLTNAAKKIQLDKLQAKAKQHLDSLELGRKAGLLMAGGESGEGQRSAALASGRAMKGLATPSLALSEEMKRGFYQAAKSGQNLRVELKDAASSDTTRTQLPANYVGLVDRKFEPTRILDHLPSTATSAPSVEFITHTANTVALGTPVITLGTAAAGGSFAAGTYYWKLTATNSAGETVGSNELTATLTANQQQPINWTQITGANGYRLYRGTAAGAENVLVKVITSGATVTYTDTGLAGTNASVPTVDRTASAATIAPGGQYPETSLTTVATILAAKKIGIFTTVVDELLADFPTFGQYIDVELTRQITDAENWQLINGDGTGNNLLGLLNVSGTLSRMKGASDTALDVIEMGITDLRNGPSFCEPDALIIHPSTWSTIRRNKNSQGNYILGDPGQSTVSDVWGIPILQTTQITPGVAILGNLELATQAFIREGITLAMTNSADADFTSGKVKIRTSERLMLGVSRPTALNVLTGL